MNSNGTGPVPRAFAAAYNLIGYRSLFLLTGLLAAVDRRKRADEQLRHPQLFSTTYQGIEILVSAKDGCRARHASDSRRPPLLGGASGSSQQAEDRSLRNTLKCMKFVSKERRDHAQLRFTTLKSRIAAHVRRMSTICPRREPADNLRSTMLESGPRLCRGPTDEEVTPVHASRSSFAVVTLGNVAVAAAQWYLVWLFAQQSGPKAVGDYSTLIAMTTPVFIASAVGTAQPLLVTLQRTVRWRIYLGCRLTTVGMSILIITGLVVFGPDQIDAALAWPLLLIKVSDSIGDLFYARLQKTERLFAFGLILIVVAMASATTVTVVILSTGAIVSALWAAAVVSVVGTLVTIRVAAAEPPETERPKCNHGRRFAPRSKHSSQLVCQCP